MTLTPDDLKAIGELLQPLKEDIKVIKTEQAKQGEDIREIKKDIRGLKWRATRTWNLLRWFTKDADERIVTLEKAIKQN
jgi:hypothetical protein